MHMFTRAIDLLQAPVLITLGFCLVGPDRAREDEYLKHGIPARAAPFGTSFGSWSVCSAPSSHVGWRCLVLTLIAVPLPPSAEFVRGRRRQLGTQLCARVVAVATAFESRCIASRTGIGFIYGREWLALPLEPSTIPQCDRPLLDVASCSSYRVCDDYPNPQPGLCR